MKNYEVIIIGAGTAGLSAQKAVSQQTDNYLVIDDGDLGTTCARTGCMPSKVFIQVANDFHRRVHFKEQGIKGEENLKVNSKEVMNHTRKLRDRFVRSVMSGMDSWQKDHLLRKRAHFIDEHTLDLGDEKITANKFIIATGTQPQIPAPWAEFKDFLIDTNTFFDLKELPTSLAVIGLGVIGIELGQALHRLGIEVIGIGQGRKIASLTDPKLIDYSSLILSQEMNLDFTGVQTLSIKDNKLLIKTQQNEYLVEKALVCVGRKPQLGQLGLEQLGLKLDEKGFPQFSSQTFQLKDHSHLYLVGDANGSSGILHEALNQGAIAGYHAVRGECEQERTTVKLAITFSSPQIASIGQSFQELQDQEIEFEWGEVSFEGQGRSIVMLKEKGHLRVYGCKKTGTLLGAEIFSPAGEHLAHLLSWVIVQKLTIDEVLKLPFYHPTLEEGLKTALKDLAFKLPLKRSPLSLASYQEHETSHCR